MAFDILDWVNSWAAMTPAEREANTDADEVWQATIKPYMDSEGDLPWGPFSDLDTLRCLGMERK